MMKNDELVVASTGEVVSAASLHVADPFAGEADIQVTTAKRYPRSLKSFREKTLAWATVDEETAGSCFYTLPRDGKKIEGPSVRLAEIASVCYGNLRVMRRVVEENERFVVCAAMAWDCENNVQQATVVQRRITRKDGSRFSDDMIANTVNAGLAIAGRNATFLVVPRSFINEIAEVCKKVARGDAATLSARRIKAVDWFQTVGLPSAKVFAGLGVRGIEDVTLEHLEILTGLRTAIREGEVKPEDAFVEAAPAGRGDPVAEVMAMYPVTGEVAQGLVRDLEDTILTPAGRLALLKKHAGNSDALWAELRAMRRVADADRVAAGVTAAMVEPIRTGLNVSDNFPLGAEPSVAKTLADQGDKVVDLQKRANAMLDAEATRQAPAEMPEPDPNAPASSTKPRRGRPAAGKFGF